MRSHVCFDVVHSNRLRLLIEYGMSTGLHCFGEYRGSHIVFPFSLLASGPWLEADDTESWDRWGRLCLMFWHVYTRACPHPCMLALALYTCMQAFRFAQQCYGPQSLSKPHIQLGFFIQQSAFGSWPGIKFTVFINPIGVCTLGHTPFIVLFASSNDWVFSDVF